MNKTCDCCDRDIGERGTSGVIMGLLLMCCKCAMKEMRQSSYAKQTR